MGPEQEPASLLARDRWRIHVQRVVHVHRRVVGREVERGEVVPLGLHLRAHGHGETETAEDLHDLVYHPGHGMLGSNPAATRGHAEVDPRRLAPTTLRFQHLPPGGKRRLEAGLEPVDGGAIALPLVERAAREPISALQ